MQQGHEHALNGDDYEFDASYEGLDAPIDQLYSYRKILDTSVLVKPSQIHPERQKYV